jgi:hypothetical protein
MARFRYNWSGVGGFRPYPSVSGRGTGSEYCREREEWVSFPFECEESQCPNLGRWNGSGLACRHAWDWEAEVVRNNARMYLSGGGGTPPTWREWDLLRGDPEFAAEVEEHDRTEREERERSRRLSEEALQGRDDFARRIEAELRAEGGMQAESPEDEREKGEDASAEEGPRDEENGEQDEQGDEEEEKEGGNEEESNILAGPW